jgi:hypothetical protein
MNSSHDNGENGRLDEDLDGISRAYRQMDVEEPPELLDLAIRNSAHRAVEKKPGRVKFGWLHGLTTAAVFVLALSVIMHQRENQPAVGNGVQFDRPHPASAAGPDKRQSPASVSGQNHNAREEAPKTVKDQTAPAPAAPVSEPREQTLGEAFRASRQKESAAPVQQTATADSDENQAVLEKAVEKKEADKPALESMADAPEDAGQAAAANPSDISALAPAEPEARGDIDLHAEKQLKAIIEMKRNGDENWKAALKTFIDDHPGYPVPDELKD